MTENDPRTRDSRWIALVVLCAGMLMIILDAVGAGLVAVAVVLALTVLQPATAAQPETITTSERPAVEAA